MVKKRTIKSLAVAILVTALLAFPTGKLTAVSESTVALGNVLGSGLTTLIRGLIQKRVHNLMDALECLAYGSVAGYGFYQSKKLVAADHVFSGVLLANLSASVIDNITAGEGPLSYIGFSLPAVRIEIATPLAKKKNSLLRFTVSPREAIALVQAGLQADRVSLRNGMLAFETDTPLEADVRGWARTIFPTVVTGKPESVYRHEMVHVVQSLQLMAGSPEPFLKSHRREGKKVKFLQFGGVRLQALGLLNDLTLSKMQSYDNYWKEAEAYHFVESE